MEFDNNFTRRTTFTTEARKKEFCKKAGKFFG